MKWPLLIVVLFALFAGEARAAPPVLVSVTSQSRHPAATWTLPPGVQAEVIEIATAPTTASDGSFFAENREVFDLLEATQTSWLYEYQLDPGTYYVHVSGFDEACFYADQCPVREYSAIMTLVIPEPAKPVPREPKQALALSAARAAGSFDVKTRVTSATNIDRKRGDKDEGTWTLTPVCSSGACSVRLHFHFGLVGSKSLTMRLVRSGAVYKGTGRASLSQCSFKDVAGTLSVRLAVTKGAWIGNSWRATRISGSYRWVFPSTTSGIYRCPAGSLAATVTGTLSQ